VVLVVLVVHVVLVVRLRQRHLWLLHPTHLLLRWVLVVLAVLVGLQQVLVGLVVQLRLLILIQMHQLLQ
jgi:hypothetical protein